MNSRSLQAQKTKSKIYSTSIELFKRKGFENVTIQDIAKEANVSVGSFYNYYKSKNDILNENYIAADEVFRKFAGDGVEGNSAKEKIIKYMLFYIDFVINQPFDFIKILYNNDNKLFIKDGRAMQTLLNPIIEEGFISGEITVFMNVNEINEFLYQSMRGLIFHWCLHEGGFNIHERAEKYLALLVKAL